MSFFSRRELLIAVPALAFAARAAPFEVLADYPQELQTPLSALDGLLTPVERFFVRSHFGPPSLQAERGLEISGLVGKPFQLTPAQLKKLPQTTITAVLQCAGNGRAFFSPTIPGVQWQHGAMGQAEWTGVRLATLLEKAKIASGAAHVHLFGADRTPKPQTPPFIRSIPLARALHPDTLIAWKMNGAPLTLEHGAPLRVVVPGWAGDHWLKWLTGIHVAAEEHDGFFVKKGYRIPPRPVPPGTKVPPEQMEPVTVLPVKSVITAPTEGATVKAGKLEVRGVAFSGAAAISQVEVSVDDGKTWSPAKLEGTPGLGRWQIFKLEVDAGATSAMVRATDATGAVQPQATPWNPSGYFWNSWHQVRWSLG